MKFIEPSVEEIYKIISNNNKLIDHLKKEKLLLTKEQFATEINKDIDVDTIIYVRNINSLYKLANVLFENKDAIKNGEMWKICSDKIGYKEMAESFGVSEEDLNIDIYKDIMFSYKYGYVDSFFQNNKDKFMSDIDYEELIKNESLNALVDAFLKEFDRMDYIIGTCSEYRDFDKIPFSLINYFSQLLGFEKANLNIEDQDEKKYREIIKNIIDIYRVKGSNYSFEVFFKFMGYNIGIKEFYFDRRLYYSGKGNIHTNEVDINKFGYYLTPKSPAENGIETYIDEYVGIQDFSKQLSLRDFDDLVDKYGVEAVLGYSQYDKNNKEYTGEVYKYFKTNVVYYNVSLDKENPTDEQVITINKILSFLTPAYIMKTTKINVYSGATENSLADNTIFFDRNVDLEKMEENIDEDDDKKREELRRELRNKYPIMLDSEKRDSNLNSKLYTTGEFPHLKEMGDNGIVRDYKNSGGNVDYKEKINLRTKSDSHSLNIDNMEDTLKTKKALEKNSGKRKIDFKTGLEIDEFVNTDPELNKIKYERVQTINTLNLVNTINVKLDPPMDIESAKNEAEKIYNSLSLKYEFANDFEHVLEVTDLKVEKINPYTLDNKLLSNLRFGSNLLCIKYVKSNQKINSIGFSIYLFSGSSKNLKNYNNTYDLRLVENKNLSSRGRKKRVEINVPSKHKIEGKDLKELYSKIKEYNINTLDYYYYSEDDHTWFTAIKTPKLKNKKIADETGKAIEIKYNNDILPEVVPENPAHPIMTVYKNGSLYSKYSFEGFNYNNLDKLFEDEKIPIYNNFLFYIEDILNPFNSGTYHYVYINKIKGKQIYSTKDNVIYRLNNSYKGYTLDSDFQGAVKKNENDEYYLYSYDEHWPDYSEYDNKNFLITYNNAHKVVWNNIGINKILSRPIKILTDKEINDDTNLKELIFKEIMHESFNYFGLDLQKEILKGAYDNDGNKIEVSNFYDKLYNENINYRTISIPPFFKEKNTISELWYDAGSLFKDMIEYKNIDSFIKEYYYKELLKRWRESFLSDENIRIDKEEPIKDEFIYKYEKMNGMSGRLFNTNTINPYYVGDNTFNIPFTFDKNTLLFKISNKDLTMVHIEDIKLVKPCFTKKNFKTNPNYSIKSIEVNTTDTVIELKDFFIEEGGICSSDGYLVINKIQQLFMDNNMNTQNSSISSKLLNKEDWFNLGDDRLIIQDQFYSNRKVYYKKDIDGNEYLVKSIKKYDAGGNITFEEPVIDFSNLKFVGEDYYLTLDKK